jgi:hypothetical protein
MPKTIDLRSAARSADAAAFRDAVRVGAGKPIGTDRFTASGSDKAGAPVRPQLGRDSFTASGFGKTDAPVRPNLSGDDFTASGVGKGQ